MTTPIQPGYFSSTYFPAGYWQVTYQYWQHLIVAPVTRIYRIGFSFAKRVMRFD